MNIPRIPPEIITYLDNLYSPSLVKNIKNQDDLKYLQGQLSVVDALRSVHEHQKREGNILNVRRTTQN